MPGEFQKRLRKLTIRHAQVLLMTHPGVGAVTGLATEVSFAKSHGPAERIGEQRDSHSRPEYRPACGRCPFRRGGEVLLCALRLGYSAVRISCGVQMTVHGQPKSLRIGQPVQV